MYNTTLRNLFPTSSTRSPRAYGLLACLPFKVLITTNFDPHLFDAAQTAGIKRYQIYPELNAYDLGHGDKAFCYLHGRIIDKKEIEIVLTESEFTAAYANDGPVPAFLNQVLRATSVLFVGCSLQDPPMGPIFDLVKKQIAATVRRNPGLSPPFRLALQPRRWRPVTGGPDDQIISRELDLDQEAAETARFAEMGVDVVWYEPEDERHIGLVRLLTDVARIFDLEPRREVGYQKEYPK